MPVQTGPSSTATIRKCHPRRLRGRMARSPKTVLIVDDSAAIRRELCSEFTRRGFIVCAEAENGRQAIEKVYERLPDLIILDLSMPVMNGLDAAPELRRIAPKTP